MLRVMNDGPPAIFDAMFVVVPIFIACVIVLGIYTTIRNRNALKQAGYDPITAQVQMADRLIRSQEHPSLESRLKELDDLHARGVISAEEHAKARADALAQP
ncbi:MAG: hypothetical protein JWO22_3222 [Frankiales bacterium]|nr:hypothetical protein [Frankiales bacterium]